MPLYQSVRDLHIKIRNNILQGKYTILLTFQTHFKTLFMEKNFTAYTGTNDGNRIMIFFSKMSKFFFERT